MAGTYCYWSVCDGVYGAMMEKCVETARHAGVFKEFHVLSDRPLAGCECYDAFQCDKAGGLFKLHYLKVGMSRLPFDYFVWVDADSLFASNPDDLLGALCRAPLHVPLEFNLSEATEDLRWKGVSCARLRKAFRDAGVTNKIYLSRSAFWVVKREAIDAVYNLALQFWNGRPKDDILFDVDAALGYAMQMLCASPEAHLLTCRPDLWASDDLNFFADHTLNARPWAWRHPLARKEHQIRPSIIHLPRKRHIADVIPVGGGRPSPFTIA